MEKDGLYLLTIGQVLENTKNISNIGLYYNRISVVNNLRRYENNYCWVHETKSQLKPFPDPVSCACVDPKNELDLRIAARRCRCPQELYVANLSNELKNANLIVDFSSSQCISLVYKGCLYLYSNLSTCKLSNASYAEKEGSKGIICEDCKIGDALNFSKSDLERALYDIVEKGEDQRYGLTLLEHMSLGNPLNGLEKVQDSVKSIGILEGLIPDEPKQSDIDKINVIECDILLEDVANPAVKCGRHAASRQRDCNNCQYMSDLNRYLNSPIVSYCDQNPLACEHPAISCEHNLMNCRHATPGARSCYHRAVCERCNISCNNADHVHKDCKIRPNCDTCHCAKCIHGCAKCERAADGEKLNVRLKEGKLNRAYLLECVKYADELVEKAARELDSICSSLINQANALCQPPLNISIRFLEHFLCFEYLIEYSCDGNSFKDSLYEVGALDRQNVILHEFIQANVLSRQVLEHTFDIILARIKKFTTPKVAADIVVEMIPQDQHSDKITAQPGEINWELGRVNGAQLNGNLGKLNGQADLKAQLNGVPNHLGPVVNGMKQERNIYGSRLDGVYARKHGKRGRQSKRGLHLHSRYLVQPSSAPSLESSTEDIKMINMDAGLNQPVGMGLNPFHIDGSPLIQPVSPMEANLGAAGMDVDMNIGLNQPVGMGLNPFHIDGSPLIQPVSPMEANLGAAGMDVDMNIGLDPATFGSLESSPEQSREDSPDQSSEELLDSGELNVETPPAHQTQFGSEAHMGSFDLNETKLEFPSDINIGSGNTLNTSQEIFTGSPGTDPVVSDDSLHESDGKNGASEPEEAAPPEVFPYWWSFYEEDNTLGEGDLNGRFEGIRRFTRSSYLKEESSTPKNKKTGNGANYLLTRCVSSDFSTKSNINVSGLHSSRETLCPSEFNHSQPSDAGAKLQICFCKTCIPFFSNITRFFPNTPAAPSDPSPLSSSRLSNLSSRTSNETDRGTGRSISASPDSASKLEADASKSAFNLSSRDEEIDKELTIVNGLRRSIRVALDVGTAIRKKIKSEHKPLMDTLNVALLSSFRLGEFLFNNPGIYGANLFAGGSVELDNRFELYEKGDALIDKIRGGERTAGNRTPELGEEKEKSERSEEEIGNFLCIDVAVDALDTARSTFESDQYLAYDIVSDEDACSYSSLSSSSPKMFNKRKSPTRSRRTYRSLSSFDGLPCRRSFEGLPTSRRSTRELSQTDDMYIYDMNNLSDKGEYEDWYVDSDSSKKSSKFVHKRMPPSRPSVSNLTEIYGSQDMLIPMGPLPIGVYFDASRKLWRCQWRENGKFRTKGFSLGHYNTLADARHACILFRCQVGNMSIQPEWLSPNYIKVSDLLNRRAAQPSSTPKKSSRKKKRQEDMYETYS